MRTIYLRYPSWSKDVTVRINDKRTAARPQKDGYIALTRTWKDGDRIEATFPMHLQLERTPDNPQRAALLYGPIVMAGELGTGGMKAPAPHSDPSLYNDYYTYDYHIPANLPTQLAWDSRHPERNMERTGKGLTFKTPSGVTVSPLYDIHRQRYVVYWDIEDKK